MIVDMMENIMDLKPTEQLDLPQFVDRNEEEEPVTYEDIKTGFELFFANANCPSPLLVKLFTFLDELLSSESSRTIIQSIVNLFLSGSIKDKTSLSLAKEFYIVLASTLNLQHGNILLATSTRSQLQTMIDEDWPFFTNCTSLVKTCLKESDCDGVQDIVQKLGKQITKDVMLMKLTVVDGEGVSRELSLHPVHLTRDKKGELPPSALVPFCSYQADYDLLGQKSPKLNLTTCNKFEPIILEGQLCHSLDIAKVEKKKKESKAGKPNGLVLLLDPNPYRLKTSYKVNMGDQSYEEGRPKVYVHTLAQYTAYGPGTYALSSLKRMTGTESFMELPDEQKRCRVHKREECQTKKFLDQVWNKCRCVPWALMDGTLPAYIQRPLWSRE